MKLGKSKITKPEDRHSSSKDTVRVHSYYTLPSRERGRAVLDTRKRASQKKQPLTTVLKKSRRIPQLLFVWLGVIVAVFLLAYLTTLTTSPVVVVDSSPSLGRELAYSQGIASLLEGSIWRRNKLTLDKEKLIEDIRREFPEVQDITVSTALLGKRPVIHIEEFEMPFQLEAKGKTYVINSDGVIVGESSSYAMIAKAITIRDESGIDAIKGVRLLRSDDATFFTEAEQILSAKGRVLIAVKITSVPREAYLMINGVNYTARVYLDDPVDNQVATFLAAERELGEGGLTPVSYIDVRAGEKVYWQ